MKPLEPDILLDLIANDFDAAGLRSWIEMRWEDAGLSPGECRAMIQAAIDGVGTTPEARARLERALAWYRSM